MQSPLQVAPPPDRTPDLVGAALGAAPRGAMTADPVSGRGLNAPLSALRTEGPSNTGQAVIPATPTPQGPATALAFSPSSDRHLPWPPATPEESAALARDAVVAARPDRALGADASGLPLAPARALPTVAETRPVALLNVEPSTETAMQADAAKPEMAREAPTAACEPKLPRLIGQQLAEAVRLTQGGQIEVALNPEELGRVRMTLNAGDSSITVLLTVERPETADLMRRNLAALGTEFRQLGYSEVSFSFSGQNSQYSGPAGDPGAAASDRAAQDLENVEAPPAPRIAPAAGLDLRI